MQSQIEKLELEVVELKHRLKQQQEHCSRHHIYDVTSPLMTAEMIVESPVTAADNAVLGLLDMVQQVWKTCGEPHFTEPATARCACHRISQHVQIQRGVLGLKLSTPVNLEASHERKKEQESLQELLSFVQNLLRQLAAAAHDISACVQKAVHQKSHPVQAKRA
jgi:hypothetical protein